jgi:predicted dehydrogenase
MVMFTQGCSSGNDGKKADTALVHLIMLGPGHFHAALLQKSMYRQIDSTVYLYAPDGPEVKSYLALINQYNTRSDAPTAWKEKIYTGQDFLEKMLKEKNGNVVVIAGNNRKKTDYILKSIDNRQNVLADKPMAITKAGFEKLKTAFADAKQNNVLLYDIMTERYEITNILQKAFSRLADVFGELKKGTPESPAVTFESVHHFYKEVSGSLLVRPAWYFDVDQQGEGIVDVTTHFIDLIQWECFPEVVLNYKKDIQMLSARHWPTVLTLGQFRQVTGKEAYPAFLRKDVKDSLLKVYANGEMNYTIKGVHARVSVIWKFAAPKGSGDTYYAKLEGTKATLVIKQGEEQHYKPVLYIEPAKTGDQNNWEQALKNGLDQITEQYPGITLKESNAGWEVVVPEKYNTGHEQHFALVIQKYLQYLQDDSMPDWETSYMLAKYYTTTEALKKAEGQTVQ